MSTQEKNKPLRIGDKVWLATTGTQEEYVKCPTCCGECYVMMILGDGEKVRLECEECRRGYEFASGKVHRYVFGSKVELVTISGVDSDLQPDGSIKYEYSGRISSHNRRIYSEDKVFETKEEAEACAKILMKEHQEKEDAKVFEKYKSHNSWAWHVGYYRGQLKAAQRSVEFYEKKLGIARKKAKK